MKTAPPGRLCPALAEGHIDAGTFATTAAIVAVDLKALDLTAAPAITPD